MTVIVPLFGGDLAGCGDDGRGGAGTAASETGPPGDGGPGGSGPSTSTQAETGASTSSSTGPSDTTAGSSGAASTEGDGTTSGISFPIELGNDGWAQSGSVFFQGGFVMGECWASTFVPEPQHYPFEVTGASMVVGGNDMGAADFSIAIFSVDGTGQPFEELAAGTANINGDDNALDSVPLQAIGVRVPPITEGDFALVVCFTDHDGFPGIAADADGLTYADRNFIRLVDGSWITAAEAGVSGDFITRATILPSGP